MQKSTVGISTKKSQAFTHTQKKSIAMSQLAPLYATQEPAAQP